MYINARQGRGVTKIRTIAGPPSPLTMMGVGGCGMGEDWTVYGQTATTGVAAPPAVTAKAEPGFWDRLGEALKGTVAPPIPVTMPMPMPMAPPAGMSTTTKLALAGGAVLMLALIANR